MMNSKSLFLCPLGDIPYDLDLSESPVIATQAHIHKLPLSIKSKISIEKLPLGVEIRDDSYMRKIMHEFFTARCDDESVFDFLRFGDISLLPFNSSPIQNFTWFYQTISRLNRFMTSQGFRKIVFF